jgi:hypothetical protein
MILRNFAMDIKSDDGMADDTEQVVQDVNPTPSNASNDQTHESDVIVQAHDASDRNALSEKDQVFIFWRIVFSH